MSAVGSSVSSTRRGARACWPWILTAFFLVLLADFLRDQERKNLVFDEALTALLAGSETWVDFQRSLRCGAHHTPPAYFLALRGWISIAGDDATALRLPSLVLTIVGTSLLAAALRPTFGLWPSLLAATSFTASSDMLLAHANDARPYAAWWAAQNGWLLLVARAGARGSAGLVLLAGVAVLAFLAPAVHYAAFPFVCASCAALLAHGMWTQESWSVRLAGATALGALVFTASHLELALTQEARNVYGAWIPEPTLSGALRLYEDGLAPPWEVVALVTLGAVTGLVCRVPRPVPPAASPSPLVLLAAAWLCVPGVLACVREAGGPNLFYTRYCLPLQAVGTGIAAALAGRALRNLLRIPIARAAAWSCAAVSCLRLAGDDRAHAYTQRSDTIEEHLPADRLVYTTDPFLAALLAQRARQVDRVILLSASTDEAERWDALSPRLRARRWDNCRPSQERAVLAVTQIQPLGFAPEAWANQPGLRVRRLGYPTPGAEIWFLEPEPAPGTASTPHVPPHVLRACPASSSSTTASTGEPRPWPRPSPAVPPASAVQPASNPLSGLPGKSWTQRTPSSSALRPTWDRSPPR